MQQEELQASDIDCEQENSFSTKEKKKSGDKEAAEEVRKKVMEHMASKKRQVNLRQVARKKPGEVVAMRLNS